ncbi:MAG: hypothetical protein LBN18_00360, partial [Dysgonamonadaceae bacterium]|nr:hypothetical protein [Dysgonamonadaceae bacterium]
MKQKTFNNRSKFRNFLLFSFLLLLGGNLQAQPPLKAGFINSFVLPGQKDTINVIKQSELGACTTAGIGVNILNSTAAPGTLAHGSAVLSTDGNKNIIYTPSAGFVGQDSVKYTITCGVNTSTGLVLINVTDKPNVIKDEACAVTPASVQWGFAESMVSPINVYNYISPLAGDIDGDGISEIIASNISINGVYIFKGNDFSSYRFLSTAGYNGRSGAPYGIAKWNSVVYLIVPANNGKLYAYDLNTGSLLWTSADDYHSSYTFVAVGFADFNQDGKPEIYVGSGVFDISTGALIARSPGNVGYTSDDNQSLSRPIAADVDNDGILEYVAGNEVYSVNFATNTMDLKYQLLVGSSPDGTVAIRDGQTQVADWDKDGNLDIIVSYIAGSYHYFYIWDVQSLSLKAWFQSPATNSSISIPMIGDTNGNGYPDFIYVTNYRLNILRRNTSVAGNLAYEYLSSSDQSGFTGATLFDFNQDNISEIVYRDETDLRIINASYKSHLTQQDTTIIYNLISIPLTSSTWGEYPIVIDSDSDGASEIICIGVPSGRGSVGQLRKYESSDPATPWAPARSVWNQYAYNPVYINEDLSIPPYPLNPATKFVDKDGNYLQPFNNFLQQATLLNGEGKMLSYGSDLAFDLNVPIVYSNYNSGAGTVDATFNIESVGDADFSGNLDISAYVLQSGVFTKVQTYVLNITIPAGTTVPISYTITGLPAGIDPANVLQLRINESDDNFLVPECNYSGNFSKALFGAPDYGLCPGAHTIYFYPQNSGYQYVWYNSDPTKTPKPTSIDTGDSHDFTKSATQLVEKFYVEVYDGPSLMDTYSVITYLIPDSLTWTGATSSDWNDYRNWNYPNN